MADSGAETTDEALPQSEASTEDAKVEAGKTDHTPFGIDKKHLGKEPFSQQIREFLKTAKRTRYPDHEAKCGRHVVGRAFNSHCPSWLWLSMYHGPSKEKRHPVFVDIGCNKGFSIASFYEQFSPDSGVSKKSICKLHKEMETPKYLGVCKDCKEPPKMGPSGGLSPIAFCIDGSPYTHKRTKDIANQLRKGQPLAQGWQLFHQAMTNASGTITYEDCANEDCGIARPGDKFRLKKRMRTVPAMTYDSFAHQQGITFADLVKIDTEGEEPLIIQGMHESLLNKRVGFLAFEVHGTGKGWFRAFDMQRLVDLLDAYGYNCYMDSGGDSKIILLTGCHSRRFSQSYVYGQTIYTPAWYKALVGVVPQWGNAICGLRANGEISQILYKLSQLKAKPEPLLRPR